MKEIIDGLKDLIKDRESFLVGDEDHDAVFLQDIEVLKETMRLLEDREVLCTAICVFCKENAKQKGVLTGCASCRYGKSKETLW